MRLLLVMLACSIGAAAQPSNGYMVGGGGVRDSKPLSEGAVGGEWVIAKGIGVGGEVGFVAGHSGFGEFSANAYYHFPTGRRRFDPFVTGGYTAAETVGIFGGSRSTNCFNAGGGVNFWLVRHFGLRAEVRDIAAPGSSANFLFFRGGLLFH
jgi:hypothetical protein